MSGLKKAIFLAAHEIQQPGFYNLYKSLMRNQWRSRQALRHEQDMMLRRMVRFCFDRVPFYRRRFKEIGITPSDIRTHSDLDKIPPIRKEDMLSAKSSFVPIGWNGKYYLNTTGGTTGTNLTFRLSRSDRFLSGALLYRGWSGGGYCLGNRMMVLAGASLVQDAQSLTRMRAIEFTRNLRLCSAFRMSPVNLEKYLGIMRSWKPSFLRGYPSALNEFAEYIERQGKAVPKLKGVYTTAEKLYPEVRRTLERVFNVRVFDGYGANDGGAGAHEYECGNMHVDTERSFLEAVDEDNSQIANGKGRVLVTSLKNFAMPFLRYELGDEVLITDEECSCGRGLPMLKEVIGRTTSVLVTPDGSRVHGWFFRQTFGSIGEGVRKFKVVQETERNIRIDIVPGPGFNDGIIQRIRTLVNATCSDWNLDFHIVESIPKSKSGKLIFIESKVRP
jgi:phenylacetate-CoA ligase